MTTPTEFSGAPLVAGSVVGVRAFNVDGLSRLRGVTHPQVWTPGENVADCKIPVWTKEAVESFNERALGNYRLGANGAMYRDYPQYRLEGTPHDIGTCSCGFYAYYSGRNDYGTDERVQAVIEGWGETAIGTRGFRTSKARVLALCIKGDEEKPKVEALRETTVAQAFRWLRDRLGYLGAAAAFPGLFTSIVHGNTVWAICLAVAIVANIGLQVYGDNHKRRAKSRRSALVDLMPPKTTTSIDMAKLRRNYPDVPIFTDYARMVAEFPTSRGEEPTPETDPDFWTRSI